MRRIEKYRRVQPGSANDYNVGCILLQSPFFFQREEWIPVPEWPRQAVQGKGYSTDDKAGLQIWAEVRIPQRKLNGKPQHHDVCGILMHSSLAITLDGLPLGLTAIKFWSRDKFYGCNHLKKSINPTRIPIEHKESYRWLENVRQSTALIQEPARCVHIGDRESDIYELFCTAQAIGTHFIFRTCVDRLAGDGKHTIATEMKEVRVQGLHRVEVTVLHPPPYSKGLAIKWVPAIINRRHLRVMCIMSRGRLARAKVIFSLRSAMRWSTAGAA